MVMFLEGGGLSLALVSFFFSLFFLSFFFSAFSLILLLPGGKLSVLRIFWGRFCLMPASVNMFSWSVYSRKSSSELSDGELDIYYESNSIVMFQRTSFTGISRNIQPLG